MTTGDQNDVTSRLASILPPSWFPNPAPNITGLLQGFANAGAWLYSLVAFAKLQTRISTASGVFLDLISFDLFGRAFPRMQASDAEFAATIKTEFLVPRNTRAGLIGALVSLTGQAPTIIQPATPSDTGAYEYAMGYSLAGAYGSLLMPNQALVVAYRPATSGIPTVAGYGVSSGGYGVGAIEYADLSDVIGPVTDAQIYEAVAAVSALGTMPWTRLASGLPPTVAGYAYPLAGNNADLGSVAIAATGLFLDMGSVVNSTSSVADMGTA